MTANMEERRSGSNEVIDKMLAERGELLATYCGLAGVTVGDKQADADIQRFCEILTDYTAFVHFEIYERIIDGRERRQAVKDEGKRLYAQITELTHILLVFIDDFADMTVDIDREKLHTDLNALGEVLAARFELEDQILHAIRGV